MRPVLARSRDCAAQRGMEMPNNLSPAHSPPLDLLRLVQLFGHPALAGRRRVKGVTSTRLPESRAAGGLASVAVIPTANPIRQRTSKD